MNSRKLQAQLGLARLRVQAPRRCRRHSETPGTRGIVEFSALVDTCDSDNPDFGQHYSADIRGAFFGAD
jgi:hypothetical protein